ncbi:MAG: hypothetical protein U0670_13270 [Anaerolineae bacterium]
MNERTLATPRWVWIALAAILIACVGLAGGYAIRTPAWQAPDEPAHYNYVAQIAANGCCPVIEPGDWDSAYLDQLKAAHFPPEMLDNLRSIQYEDHQPPLYYLIGYAFTSGGYRWLRLYSVLLGAAATLIAFFAARIMFPDRPIIPLSTAAFFAFVPQHLAGMGSVTNDALADGVIAVGLLAAFAYLRGFKLWGRTIPAWALGGIAGIGLLTKASTLMLGLILPVAILLRWWNEGTEPPNTRRSIGRLISAWVSFGVPALLIGGVWAVRNISVYGFPDIFGLAAHNRVVVGQLRTATVLAEVGWGEYLRRVAETTFNSFWGQFGWMALPLNDWMYTAIVAGLALVAVGGMVGIIAAVRRNRPAPTSTDQADGHARRAMWIIVWLTIGLAAAQYAYYNTEFYQLQGRYLFTALIPLGICIGWGLDALVGLIDRSRRSALQLVALLPFAALIVLNGYLVWRVIPLLAP